MERLSFEPGRIVTSRQGRDTGRNFVILETLDPQYVRMADGFTRKLNNPKKKKTKHLHARPALVRLAEITGDSDLRKALEQAGYGVKQPTKEG